MMAVGLLANSHFPNEVAGPLQNQGMPGSVGCLASFYYIAAQGAGRRGACERWLIKSRRRFVNK